MSDTGGSHTIKTYHGSRMMRLENVLCRHCLGDGSFPHRFGANPPTEICGQCNGVGFVWREG